MQPFGTMIHMPANWTLGWRFPLQHEPEHTLTKIFVNLFGKQVFFVPSMHTIGAMGRWPLQTMQCSGKKGLNEKQWNSAHTFVRVPPLPTLHPQQGHEVIVDLLLKNGAAVDVADEKNETPLDLAHWVC